MKEKSISRRGFVTRSTLGVGGLALGRFRSASGFSNGEDRLDDHRTSEKGDREVEITGDDITIENSETRMIIGANARVKSLFCKTVGEECVIPNNDVPISSIFQQRPFNNEIKLAHPCEEMTFGARSVRKEGDRLYINYELIHYEAVIRLDIKPDYIGFELEGFNVPEDSFGLGVLMKAAPVEQIWFLQIPVRKRVNYGDWLQVVWDDRVTTNLMAPDPFTRIDAETGNDYHVLKAGAERSVKLNGARVCLINSSSDKFLDIVERLEGDYGIPDSVKSRRSKEYLYSYYWSGDINSSNLEHHLTYARMGGFRAMSVYYPAFLESQGYSKIGNYEWDRSLYPNGEDDFRKFLDRIKSAGIIPGYHFLHSHIGLKSKYVTPVPDHRLNIVQWFTIAVSLGQGDTEIYLDQDPSYIEMTNGRRVVRVGTELITYEGFSNNRPYKITGCERGAYDTKPEDHPVGAAVGVLDVSEFGATSAYINQSNDLQDEVAEKIGKIYNTGFRFCYFDGSEGVNAPFWSNVAYAQWRVYKRFEAMPLFAEGAAKTHFSWHLLSRGNAFDVFKPEVLKQSIREHPAAEAPRMRANFTHVNFGWLGYWVPGKDTIGTQPDMLEYATSRAAAWDCHVALMSNLDLLDRHPRTKDNLEVLRRWEEVRVNQLLTREQKLSLQNLNQEHILLIDESDRYEVQPYDQIENIAGNSKEIRAFIFERKGDVYVVYWHISGSAKIKIPVQSKNIQLKNRIKDKSTISFAKEKISVIIPVDHRRFIRFKGNTRESIITAFRDAEVI